MKVYIVFDCDNLVQHELIEVFSSEEAAKARCVELNGGIEDGSWVYDDREVK